MRRVFVSCLGWAAVLAAVALDPSAQTMTSAGKSTASLKFAVIGDFGTGERPQYDIADRMFEARAAFPFTLVLALGDNMYGRQQPADFVQKFERPFARLLQAGVVFQAALGNHDRPENRDYAAYNMGGERYYTFVRPDVRFVVLDSNMMEPKQLAWANQTLAAATEPWKIVYFHHPIYSDGGRHGSNVELRVLIEPILLKYGVRAVFNGHEHFYERTTPQKGITYFIAGSGGQLRKGDVRRSPLTAAAFDQDQAFMLVAIDGDQLSFQAISRTGATVDAGVIERRPTT
jgi:hypothetical protein